jgi:hypothetical protein
METDPGGQLAALEKPVPRPRRTVVSKPVVNGLRCQIQSLRDVLHRSALLPGKLKVEELLR